MPGPRRFRFTLAQLLLAAMFLALVLGLGLTMRSCAFEPFRAEWLAFSPDGGALGAGLEYESVKVWDVDTDEAIADLAGRIEFRLRIRRKRFSIDRAGRADRGATPNP